MCVLLLSHVLISCASTIALACETSGNAEGPRLAPTLPFPNPQMLQMPDVRVQD